MLCMHHRAEQGVVAPLKEEQDAVLSSLPDDIPKPVIKIDNQHDPFATVVTIEYGDRLGELLDTVSPSASLYLCAVMPLTTDPVSAASCQSQSVYHERGGFCLNLDGSCSDVCLAPSRARSCPHESCHSMTGRITARMHRFWTHCCCDANL